MKPPLLTDENFPAPSVAYLRAAGFDVVSVTEYRPGISDTEVLNLAVAQARWLITFDRDYGELVFAQQQAHPIALLYLRLHTYRPEDPGRMIDTVPKTPAA